MKICKFLILSWISFFSLSACSQSEGSTDNGAENQLSFAADNGSIKLPPGFKAVLVADNLGNGRHLTVRHNGDIYLKLGAEKKGKGIVALRDENGDGIADRQEYFGEGGGTGIKIYQGYLYYSTNTHVFRKKFKGDELVPSGPDELILTLAAQSQHGAHPIVFDKQGYMYVNIGAPSNACQDPDRQPGVPGQDPCPLLAEHGGIWRFSATQPDQHLADGVRYATGIRNAVGIYYDTVASQLYAMQHGRDQLHEFWPSLYSEAQSAALPAEEMLEVNQGDDFGWPYCYYDQQKNKKVLNPEYGGDGDKVGRCAQAKDPIIAFPGHWAPNALCFYHARSFPAKYRAGAFIAFHGSWNRAPLPQQGYKVVFVPFANGKPTGTYEDFATEFANDGGPIDNGAEYRPCGLAVGPDGSLYICDSVEGRIWRIVYTGA